MAFAIDGVTVACQEDPPPARHSARLTLLIEACMAQAGMGLKDLDAVALSHGPGSYTGLRVGASAAKGICFALEKPLLALDTLWGLAWGSRAALAENDREHHLFMPMLDARRQEVWTAIYDHQLQVLQPTDILIVENNLLHDYIQPFMLRSPNCRVVLSGSGAKKAFTGANEKEVVLGEVGDSTASFFAELAEQKFQNADFEDVSYYEPFYMKPPNITVSKK
ncbi:MAG: tRNA (adenosine(37)-N6)-threonylcarbamoyltransferase complex dimerization subunit type 1 TsaB [Lewinellaceae bacterium]|nr:tRNA (adenosine(37)-N6)-threonylcarbamoyltransferase complex dimerization subunit type 1 TsaB [Lewinellaceae bacterium]